MNATSLALVVAGLASGGGVCHTPGERCPQCRAFWRYMHEVLATLEDEVQQLHAQVAGVRQATIELVETRP
jgi:hypothetical protein